MAYLKPLRSSEHYVGSEQTVFISKFCIFLKRLISCGLRSGDPLPLIKVGIVVSLYETFIIQKKFTFEQNSDCHLKGNKVS